MTEKTYADRHQHALKSQVEDKMFLNQIWKKISCKMIHYRLIIKYDRSFKVKEKVGEVS